MLFTMIFVVHPKMMDTRSLMAIEVHDLNLITLARFIYVLSQRKLKLYSKLMKKILHLCPDGMQYEKSNVYTDEN